MLDQDMLAYNQPLLTAAHGVPSEIREEFTGESFVAGIIEAALIGMGFVRHLRSFITYGAHPTQPCKVSAHPTATTEQPRKVTYLIKFSSVKAS